MTFAERLDVFIAAAKRSDGAAAAACFTEDGAYHDVFYGTFRGRDAIVDMIETHFHRDGEDFRWTVEDPISDGSVGYARYIFSSKSKASWAGGKRSVFEGIAKVRLKDGLFADYDEVANAAVGLSLIGMDDARLGRFVSKQAADLAERPEAAPHFK